MQVSRWASLRPLGLRRHDEVDPTRALTAIDGSAFRWRAWIVGFVARSSTHATRRLCHVVFASTRLGNPVGDWLAGEAVELGDHLSDERLASAAVVAESKDWSGAADGIDC